MNTAAVAAYISDWLRAYCHTSGLNGFVVGVSGGVDSAVTSTLCAMTGLSTTVVSMPIYQKPDQHDLSLRHCQALSAKFSNVSANTLDLSAVFSKIENDFPIEIQDDLSMANTRSRLRMLTLYTFASSQSALVAGTGNKIEDFGVGFFTKYGDGGVDISPIADLMKSEVFALGRELAVIPEILNAAPTDGLWDDDRTDEGQLGATYDELQWAMSYLEEPENKVRLSKRQQQVLEIYQQHHNRNKHKMQPIPVCLIPDSLRGHKI